MQKLCPSTFYVYTFHSHLMDNQLLELEIGTVVKWQHPPAHADHLKLIINLLKIFSFNLNTMYNNEHQILSRVYCDFSQSVSSNVYITDGQSVLLSRQSYIFTQLFCIYFSLTRVILCIDITLFSWYSISFICTQTLKQLCNQTRYNAV